MIQFRDIKRKRKIGGVRDKDGASEERERDLGWCCSEMMVEVCQIGGFRFSVCLIFYTAVVHFSPTVCSKSFPLQCEFLSFFFFSFCLFEFFNFLFLVTFFFGIIFLRGGKKEDKINLFTVLLK